MQISKQANSWGMDVLLKCVVMMTMRITWWLLSMMVIVIITMMVTMMMMTHFPSLARWPTTWTLRDQSPGLEVLGTFLRLLF